MNRKAAWSRSFILVGCIGFFAGNALPQERGTPETTQRGYPRPPELALYLEDDFQKETPRNLTPLKNGFELKNGMLHIFPGGGLTAVINSGPKLKFAIKLNWPDKKSDASIHCIAYPTNVTDFLSFSALAAGEPVGITVARRCNEAGDLEASVRLFQADSEGTPIRVLSVKNLPYVEGESMSLTIEYNYGVVRVAQDDQVLLQAQYHFHPTDIRKLTLSTDADTTAKLQSIAIEKIPATPDFTWRQKLQLLNAGKDDLVRHQFHEIGKYHEAIQLGESVYAVCLSVLGEFSPYTEQSRANLACDYAESGNYLRALKLLEQSTQSTKLLLGEQHPKYASCLSNQAKIYSLIGDDARAEPLLLQSLDITKQSLGETHPLCAESLEALAAMYHLAGNYQRSEQFFQQCLAVTKKAFGEKHPDYARNLNNLAWLYVSMGEFARAEPMQIKVMEIRKHALGQQHPDYARSLNSLGWLYYWKGDYARSEAFYSQAIATLKQVLGEQHPSYSTFLSNQALLYYSKGDFVRAEQLYTQAIGNALRQLDQTANTLVEQQQITMSQSLRYRLDRAVSCAFEMEPQPQTTLEQLVLWKGAILVRQRALRLAGSDSAIADTFKELQSKTQHLSALTGTVPGPDKLDAWKTQIADLTKEREKLDAELMQSSAAFRSAQKKVSLNDIRQAIPEDGAIIDYSEYRGKEGGSLMATVVRRGATPIMVELGSVEDATRAIGLWRKSFGSDDNANLAGKRLRKQIWEPLLQHIGEAKLVFVSAEGVLAQMPLAALPGKAEGSYLIEDNAIVMLPVPVLLPALMDRPAIMASQLSTALLLGDVDYGPAETSNIPTTEANSSAPLLMASNTRGGLTWPRLPETGREIDFIAQLFAGKSVQLRDRDATESAFRDAAANAQLLHLATHGFFAPEDKKNALSAAEIAKSQSQLERSDTSSSKQNQFVGFSPGQLSGLVFAGANRPPQPIGPLLPDQAIDDGIMTADEIAYMRLENIELAVLSACETGLGETAGGEGILGLQRAFQVAGARSTITSLWQVDDAATRVLMVEFYRNLFKRKLSKLESLRQAQLWMLNNPEAIEGRDLTTRGTVQKVKPLDPNTPKAIPTRSLPAYWAAFQLSGDPR